MKVRNPDIQVIFTSLDGDKIEIDSVEFGGEILSITTKKEMDSPAGSFSITMIGRTNYSYIFKTKKKNVSAYEIFRPASLVDIYINKQEVMLGMVDDIRKSVSISDDGKPIRTWIITGRDLGAFLIDYKVWYDEVLNIDKNRLQQNPFLKGLSAFGVMSNIKAPELIEKIVNTWMFDVMSKPAGKLTFADKKFLSDKFVASIGKGIATTCYTDIIPLQFNMMSNNADLWNYIKQASNFPFNELFVDTGSSPGKEVEHSLTTTEKVRLQEGKVYLIFRSTPFDNFKLNNNKSGVTSQLDFNDLKMHEIDDTLIQQKDLGLNRNFNPSVYYIVPNGGIVLSSLGKKFVPPEYDNIKLQRYGYIPLEINLTGITFGKEGESNQGTLMDRCAKFQKKAMEWYQNLDRMLSGKFTVYGDPSIRIGQAIHYKKDEFLQIEDEYEEGYYYIKAVDNKWVYGQNYITDVSVIRGLSKKEFGIS